MPSVPDTLKAYRAYIAMFVLNLAVVAGAIYLLNDKPARPVVVTLPPTRAARPGTLTAPIRVTVSGAVNSPGSLQLAGGALLAEALQRAGIKSEADLSNLDLMRPLQDGDKITVPVGTRAAANENRAVPTTAVRGSTGIAVTAAPGSKLNLNTATLQELEALPGIGITLAQRILDYRAQHGGFKTIDQILEVKGIGAKLFDDIKELITVQ